MSKAKPKLEWRSRVVGFVEKPANQFTANALNFRRHPNAQRDAFRGVVSEIGFAGAVLENVRTGNLIDGHLRIEEALSVDELTPIPCVQVDEIRELCKTERTVDVARRFGVKGYVVSQIKHGKTWKTAERD